MQGCASGPMCRFCHNCPLHDLIVKSKRIPRPHNPSDNPTPVSEYAACISSFDAHEDAIQSDSVALPPIICNIWDIIGVASVSSPAPFNLACAAGHAVLHVTRKTFAPDKLPKCTCCSVPFSEGCSAFTCNRCVLVLTLEPLSRAGFPETTIICFLGAVCHSCAFHQPFNDDNQPS